MRHVGNLPHDRFELAFIEVTVESFQDLRVNRLQADAEIARAHGFKELEMLLAQKRRIDLGPQIGGLEEADARLGLAQVAERARIEIEPGVHQEYRGRALPR